MKWMIIVVVLSGCQMKTLGGGSSTTPSGGGAPAAGNAPAGNEPAPPAGDPNVARPVASADGMFAVPDLSGKTLDEASAIVKRAGFQGDVEMSRPVECDNPTKVPGKIRCQDPEAGKRASSYTTFQVNIPRPPDRKRQLDSGDLHALRGLSVAKAKAKVAALGFTGTVTVIVSKGAVAGCAADQICDAQPEYGVSMDGELQLTVGQALVISAPD